MEGGVDFSEVNPLSSSAIVVVTFDLESSPPLSSPAAPTWLLLSLSPSLLSFLVAKLLRLSKLGSFDLPHLGTRAREKKQEVPLKRVSLWHWILSLKARRTGLERNSEFRGMKLQLVRVPISERNDGRSSETKSVSEWHGWMVFLTVVWRFRMKRCNVVEGFFFFLVWMWLRVAGCGLLRPLDKNYFFKYSIKYLVQKGKNWLNISFFALNHTHSITNSCSHCS